LVPVTRTGPTYSQQAHETEILTFQRCKNFIFSEKISASTTKIYSGIYFVFPISKLFINQIKKEVIMTIVKRNSNLLNNFPTLFDDFLNRDIFNWGLTNFSDTNTTIPAVNIKETSDNYEVEVAAPGMTKKDFRVQLEGNSLTISSEKTTKKEEKEEVRYTSREFSYQSFSRTFTLQKDVVDTEKIQAKYEDGVLHLLIPKMEQAKQKQPRLIEIS
jgi:HSP20 family protein